MDVIEFLNIDSSRLNADLLVEKFEEDLSVFDIIMDAMYQDTYQIQAQLPCNSRGIEARIKDLLKKLKTEVK